MNCQTCPYRFNCANIQPPRYVPKPYVPWYPQPYIPIYPTPTDTPYPGYLLDHKGCDLRVFGMV